MTIIFTKSAEPHGLGCSHNYIPVVLHIIWMGEQPSNCIFSWHSWTKHIHMLQLILSVHVNKVPFANACLYSWLIGNHILTYRMYDTREKWVRLITWKMREWRGEGKCQLSWKFPWNHLHFQLDFTTLVFPLTLETSLTHMLHLYFLKCKKNHPEEKGKEEKKNGDLWGM